MSEGIPEDKLLDIANRAVRAADAEARGEPGKPPAAPFVYPQDVIDGQIAERAAWRNGRNSSEEEKAQRERDLIRYLVARDGPTGSVWEPPVSIREQEDTAFRRLCRSIRNTFS